MVEDYDRHDVTVPGGTVRVGRWGRTGPAVLAVHGVTANHLCWAPTARRLSGTRVLAPDLRGRGGSGGLPGPYGMARHADDLAAVLDDNGIERALLVGHSMGGFVSLVFALRHPDRVAGVLLVDGGPPVPAAAGIDPDDALEAVIGQAAQRLTRTYPSRAAYVGEWRSHPAMSAWNEDIQRYVDYDLVGRAPRLRSACSLDAVRADTIDLATGSALPNALMLLRDPHGPLGTVPLLRAPMGLMAEPPGLYPPEVVAAWDVQYPALDVTTIAGTNHYTILLGPEGAEAVASAIRHAIDDEGDHE